MKIESKNKCETIPERYVDIKKVSRYTSLPISTLYEWSGTGRIPSIKIGRRRLYDLVDIDLLMESLKQSPNQCEVTANKIIGGFHGNGI